MGLAMTAFVPCGLPSSKAFKRDQSVDGTKSSEHKVLELVSSSDLTEANPILAARFANCLSSPCLCSEQ